jgi:sugar phosphate isomerase/epimerase
MRKIVPFAAAAAAVIGCAAVVLLATFRAKATSLTNPLAMRIANYGKYQEDAWTHLPSLGVHYVFLSVPAVDQVEVTRQRLAASGLRPLVLRGESDLGRESSVAELDDQLAVVEKMGVRYMFLSPKHTGVSKDVAYERLRRVGDAAKAHGVIVVLETHPDLGVNAEAHLETMRQVHHPNVRVNFDTGNITFYNQGADAVAELRKIIDYVATVELKDHNGQCMDWNFPALGRGVVDFPAILKLLEEHCFRGPITMEVEGVRGVEMTEAQTKQCIAESAAYIQSLGSFQ